MRRPTKTLWEKKSLFGYQHIYRFPQCFLLVLSFQPLFNCRMQMLLIWIRFCTNFLLFIIKSNLTQAINSDFSKLKEFTDGNFEFDENGRKFSKHVENTVGKEDLLFTSNFSFSRSVFKTCSADMDW